MIVSATLVKPAVTGIVATLTIFVVRAIVVTQACVKTVTASPASVNQSATLIPSSAVMATAAKTCSAVSMANVSIQCARIATLSTALSLSAIIKMVT